MRDLTPDAADDDDETADESVPDEAADETADESVPDEAADETADDDGSDPDESADESQPTTDDGPDDADDADDTEDDADDAIVKVLGSDDHLDYEFEGWSGDSRSLLDSLLGQEDVTHVWQGTTLVVRRSDEATVDELIEVVRQAATVGLDPDRARVAYEVGTWSAAMQTSLAEALGVADIPFEWDENGDLVVYEDDEEAVEAILDEMPDPDDPDAVDVDGVDVQDLLSRLWAASRTLAKKPSDADAVLDVIECANEIERIALPFGFEPAVWRDLVAETLSLRTAIESDDPDEQLDDDQLRDLAKDLDRRLRPLV